MSSIKNLLATQLLSTRFNQNVIINPVMTAGAIQGEPSEVADFIAESVTNDNPGLDDISELETKSMNYAFGLLGFTPING